MTYLYTSIDIKELDNRRAIPFTLVPLKSKYLGVDLTKDVLDLYKGNHKTLLKEIREVLLLLPTK